MQSLFSMCRPVSDKDRDLARSVNSMISARAVGRGSFRIDPEEISRTEKFKEARIRAKKLVMLLYPD